MKPDIYGFRLNDWDILCLVVRTDTTVWPHLLRLMAYLSEKCFSDQVSIRTSSTVPRLLHITIPRIKRVFVRAVICPWVNIWAEECGCEKVRVWCRKGSACVDVRLTPRRYKYLIANPSDQPPAQMQEVMASFLKGGMPYSLLAQIVRR